MTLFPVTPKLPPTERSVPINAFFATARPPAVVNEPPTVLLVASVVFEIEIPPATKIEPAVLEVLAVVSSKIMDPLVALELLLIIRVSPEIVPPVTVCPPDLPASNRYCA